jgi:hypothetical protein
MSVGGDNLPANYMGGTGKITMEEDSVNKASYYCANC